MQAAKRLGWLGITGLTVTAGALFAMGVAVVAAAGTIVVTAVALVCLVVGAALLAATLLVVAAGLVAGAALALTLGVAAVCLAGVFTVGSWMGRALRSLFERFGALRARQAALLQPSRSSAS